MTLRRGFKTEAERHSVRLRAEMGLTAVDSVDPREIAEHLGVRVVSAETIVERSRLEELERLQAFSFSAATFDINDRKIIVTNPIRTVGRLNSDIAHELSHIVLNHDLSEVREMDGVPFRTCKPGEEEEATAFGGTLLLPRPLLLSAVRRRASIEDIAEQFEVTVEMARFRYNTTGVAKQALRSGHA